MAIRARMRIWSVLWLALGTVYALGACSPAAPQHPGSGELAFSACADSLSWTSAPLSDERRRRLDVSCATLAVPVDHANPGRGGIDMAVVRVRAIDQHDRIGSIVLNPGGPGQPGLDYLPLWASWFPEELLTRFDLVTFDPRGIGLSSPIRCGDMPAQVTAAPLPDLLTESGFALAATLLQARVRACVDSLGDRAAAFSTDATARDLDLLRAALGDNALTFVGWSYGARLGAHYAHLFPDRVRAMVLDAPPDPQAARSIVVESQIAGFEDAFATYADQCSLRDTCAPVGDARALLDSTVRSARDAPIRSGRSVGDPPASWDVVLRAVFGFLASPESWPYLDAALREAAGGDSGSLYDMIDSLEGRTPTHADVDADDAAFVIGCNDTAAGPPAEQLRTEAVRLAQTYSSFGEFGAWWLFSCTYWTTPHPVLPVPSSTTAAPVLVVGTQGDPATPYSGAVALVRAIGPSATLLTASGGGHTAFGRLPCIGDHVTRYLIELRVPEGEAC